MKASVVVFSFIGFSSATLLQTQARLAPTQTRTEIVAAVDAAKAEQDLGRAEHLLRDALQAWPDDTPLESYLAALLFATHRLDESYLHMKSVCGKSGFEGACASSVGIDLVRNRWKEALRTAANFSETACQRSDRLWMLKQLGQSPERAVQVGKRLLTVQPDKETSYLFLAAAQWRAGQDAEARRTLTLGRKRATNVVLLGEKIEWRAEDSQRDQPP